jgi:hypothetical protein
MTLSAEAFLSSAFVISLFLTSGRQNERPIIFVAHSLGGLVCEDVSLIINPFYPLFPG